jgi:cyclohexanone monooxygenase
MKENHLDYFDTCPNTQREYNEQVQRDLQGTVWNTGGCSSYYIDQNGKNSIGFPWGTPKMKSLLSSFDLKDYVTR